MSMVIQIDGKIAFELPPSCKVVHAAVIPGKLVNLLTSVPHPDDAVPDNRIRIIEEGGVTRYEFGKNVPEEIRKTFRLGTL